jgi:hypothetical protein
MADIGRIPAPLARGVAPLALALALVAPGGSVRAAELAWTVTHYLVAVGPAPTDSTRRGIAMFSNGDLATVTMTATNLSREGNATTFRTRSVYTFEDGSTFLHEGQGRMQSQSATRNTQTGEAVFTGGTGRFEGITGKIVSIGRGLTQWDTITDFKADYTIGKDR